MRSPSAVGTAIATGAAIGAAGRWWAGDLLGRDGFPWATLLVNLVGAAVIGWTAVRLERGTLAWSFTVTGLLGGLTTASAFGDDVRRLLADGRSILAAVYVAASVLGALVATSVVRQRSMRP